MRMQTDKKIAVVHIRLTPQQRDKFYRIGGSGWLRKIIEELE